jgi:hypothetical protein
VFGVSTGHSSLCAEVRLLVAGLASLSVALRLLPDQLRRACARERAHHREIGAPYEVDLTCGLIGLCDAELTQLGNPLPVSKRHALPLVSRDGAGPGHLRRIARHIGSASRNRVDTSGSDPGTF